jgi:hypothetical protein
MDNKNLDEIRSMEAAAEDVLIKWDEILHAITNISIKNQRIIKILGISFIIDIIFTIFISFGIVHFHDLSIQEQILTCRSTNAVRINDKAIWKQAFTIITPQNPSTSQLRKLQNFQNYLNRTITTRDCNKI